MLGTVFFCEEMRMSFDILPNSEEMAVVVG